ncbi:MAG: cytochrome C, partial [Deltaproteobacteria bacterium]|nr:cytochrome C [Deltaproteobacteria bacterium]
MTVAELKAAAQSVGTPTREACGRCHFGAGGGDNVKKGDLGSAMLTPTPAADVH